MTVAPAHPPVYGYDGESPYEIIDSKWGPMERWRALAMATGEASAATELSEKVRNDSANIVARHDAREAELNSREDSIAARERQQAVNVTQFVDFVGKAATLFDRLQKARADQEREEQEPLAAPPLERSSEPEPSLSLEDAEVSGTPPGDPSETKEDQEFEVDPAGEFLKLRSPVTLDDEEEFPTGELPTPPVVQQPIAAGLDPKKELNHGD